jgi:hypothetical protein
MWADSAADGCQDVSECVCALFCCVAQDMVVFMGLLNDLFPGINPPREFAGYVGLPCVSLVACCFGSWLLVIAATDMLYVYSCCMHVCILMLID